MGRKKRKIDASAVDAAPVDSAVTTTDQLTTTIAGQPLEDPTDMDYDEMPPPPSINQTDAQQHASSHYAVSSHSAEIVSEDVYISDGSEDSEEEFLRELDIVLLGSRSGLMRRGLLHPQLQQQLLPNKQWTRQSDTPDAVTSNDQAAEQQAELKRKEEEEQELAQLDPAQRAARLLQEKQRREEEAKIAAREQENEENASREPALFSKRTAFDIRFDQIEDKPWQRVDGGNQAEFFNYGLQEEDWLDYAEQQLAIRQELMDAARNKRPPNPAIVPIQPRQQQASSAAVVMAAPATNDEGEKESGTNKEKEDSSGPMSETVVALPVKLEDTSNPAAESTSGGAWGAGAAPGSVLAKLIAEQEQENSKNMAPPVPEGRRDSFPAHNSEDAAYYGHHHGGGGGAAYNERRGGGGEYSHHQQPPSGPYGGRGGDGYWQGGRGRGDFYGGGRGRGGRGGRGRGGRGWKRPYEGDDARWRR